MVARSHGYTCDQALTIHQLEQQVREVQNEYFLDLQSTTVKIILFKSDSYFLQATPHTASLFNKKKNQVYNISVNEKLLDCPPSQIARQAILIHELQHVRDYQSNNSLKIGWNGLKYISQKFRYAYERKTDEAVLRLGLHQGLSEYRKWVYQWLSPQQLEIKRKQYYTPEEIEKDNSER